MPQQLSADASSLAARQDVSMSHERYILHGLKAHHARQFTVVVLVYPEVHSGGDVSRELLTTHIRLVPAVRGDRSAVPLCGRIDHGQDRSMFVGSRATNRSH